MAQISQTGDRLWVTLYAKTWPNRRQNNLLTADKSMDFRQLSSEEIMSLQVVDFSRVITIFHLISRVFKVFFSHNGLVFRVLGKEQGLVVSRRHHVFKKSGGEPPRSKTVARIPLSLKIHTRGKAHVCPGLSRLVPRCPGSSNFGLRISDRGMGGNVRDAVESVPTVRNADAKASGRGGVSVWEMRVGRANPAGSTQ
jgi:hypothetical protein